MNKVLLLTALLSGCALQVTDPVLKAPNSEPSSGLSGNDIENNLVLTKVSSYPALVNPKAASVLSVEYQENLGRPVSVSWACNQGTLLSDKGPRVTWVAPESSGVCECEVTIKSKSGQVRGVTRLIIE